MKHVFIWSFVFGIGCVDFLKEMLAEPEEEEEDEDPLVPEPKDQG